jgi:hypothetical protein
MLRTACSRPRKVWRVLDMEGNCGRREPVELSLAREVLVRVYIYASGKLHRQLEEELRVIQNMTTERKMSVCSSDVCVLVHRWDQ